MCRQVAANLHPGLHRVGYVSLTTGNVLDMYKAIAWELGLPTERSRATAYRAIRAEITRLLGEAKQLPVLVIDEAQHLRNDVLEDLRLLTNFAMDSDNRLCLLLVGLTEPATAPGHGRARIARTATRRADTTSPAWTATNSNATSPTACAWPAVRSPCSSPQRSRRCSRARAGCHGSSTASPHYALTAAAVKGARTVSAEHLEHAVAELRL